MATLIGQSSRPGALDLDFGSAEKSTDGPGGQFWDSFFSGSFPNVRFVVLVR